jgi:hypothetical protein
MVRFCPPDRFDWVLVQRFWSQFRRTRASAYILNVRNFVGVSPSLDCATVCEIGYLWQTHYSWGLIALLPIWFGFRLVFFAEDYIALRVMHLARLRGSFAAGLSSILLYQVKGLITNAFKEKECENLLV